MVLLLVLVLLLAAALLAAVVWAGGGVRGLVRREVIEYLLEVIPESRVEKVELDRFVLHTPQMPATQVNLANVTAAVRALKPNTRETRRTLYQRFAAPLLNPHALDDLNLEEHGSRILPRIVNQSFIDQMEEQVPMPLRALGFTGLSVAYVLDSEHHVTYIARQHAERLGLDDRELHELALANLRPSFKIETAGPALTGEGVAVIQSFDDHDAARLLLVPEHLKEGQTLAAFIPEKGTLILAPAPADDDWGSLHGFPAETATLYDRPLKVTAQGIGVVARTG